MHVPGLTESFIRAHTTEGSFERAREYIETGAVKHIEYPPGEINARVKGSYYIPYAVHVSYGAQGIDDVECTCPFHEGSWCKHIVATLLATLIEGGSVHESESVKEQLEKLSREQLIALIGQLVDMDPKLVDWVENGIDRLDR